MNPLRDYQIKSIDDVNAAWETHDRVLLCLPTGAGKTKTAVAKVMTILRQKVRDILNNGGAVLWLVQRNHLVENPAEEFEAEGVEFGFIKAGYPRNPDAMLQIGSIQTLKMRPTDQVFTHIIVDEAHNKDFDEWLLANPAKVLGLTATPVRTAGTPLGNVWQKLIVGVSYAELLRRGILVRERVWTVDMPELRELKASASTGEVPDAQQAQIMCQPKVVGDVAMWWARLSRGQSCLVFCVNISHAELVAKELQAIGATVAVVTGETPRKDRALAKARLEAGSLDVIVNVSVYKEGLDIPTLRTVILARAARSLPFYVQACNRGSRAAHGKAHFNLIDMVGAYFEHGSPLLDRPWDLPTGKVKKKRGMDGGIVITTCRTCHFVRPASVEACPECGSKLKPRTRKIGRNGNLVEVTEDIIKLLKPAAPLTGRSAEDNKMRRALFIQAKMANIPRDQQLGWVMRRMAAAREPAKVDVPPPRPEPAASGLRTIVKNGARFTIPTNPKDIF